MPHTGARVDPFSTLLIIHVSSAARSSTRQPEVSLPNAQSWSWLSLSLSPQTGQLPTLHATAS